MLLIVDKGLDQGSWPTLCHHFQMLRQSICTSKPPTKTPLVFIDALASKLWKRRRTITEECDDKKSVHSPLDAFVLEKKITERWNNFDQYVVLVKIQIRQSSTNQIWSKQCLLKIKTSLLDHDFSLFGLFWNFMFNSNILNWPTQFRHVWYLLHFNPTE